MKIALINDTHFGVRADSQVFIDYQLKFLDDVFFPYLEKNNIDTLIHLGDLLDRRKYVNFHTLKSVREAFVNRLGDMNIDTHIIIGNHDTYFKNTNDLNSVQELFTTFDGKNEPWIYSECKTVNFDGLDIAFIPWITKENHKDVVEFIKHTTAPIAMGHFELSGFQVIRGYNFDGGFDSKILKKFEMVLSGHFHIKHNKDNVYYLGTPYQMTYADLNERKGFHVFDTETRTFEFIENPHQMFFSIDYDDNSTDYTSTDYDVSQYENGYLKIFIKNKTSSRHFDRFLDRLYDARVTDITIIEEVEDDKQIEVADLAQDTITLINEEIDSYDDVDDPSRLKKLIRELHSESLSI